MPSDPKPRGRTPSDSGTSADAESRIGAHRVRRSVEQHGVQDWMFWRQASLPVERLCRSGRRSSPRRHLHGVSVRSEGALEALGEQMGLGHCGKVATGSRRTRRARARRVAAWAASSHWKSHACDGQKTLCDGRCWHQAPVSASCARQRFQERECIPPLNDRRSAVKSGFTPSLWPA